MIKAESIYGFSHVLHISGDTCTSLMQDAITTPSPRACRGWAGSLTNCLFWIQLRLHKVLRHV